MAERRFRARRRRVAAVLIGTTIAVLALGASPALANTGSVYFDASNNVGAGETFFTSGGFTGLNNVGVDRSVMPNLTSGADNTAIGRGALSRDTTGLENTAIGFVALLNNTTGDANIATGVSALAQNMTGNRNIAAGFSALASNTTGSRNVALGPTAGLNLTSGDDNVDIANPGKAGEAGTIRIGTAKRQSAAYIAGISGASVPATAEPVLVAPNGKLGTASAVSKLGSEAGDGSAVARLRAHVRRQEREIGAQAKEIATLKREVARLSRR